MVEERERKYDKRPYEYKLEINDVGAQFFINESNVRFIVEGIDAETGMRWIYSGETHPYHITTPLGISFVIVLFISMLIHDIKVFDFYFIFLLPLVIYARFFYAKSSKNIDWIKDKQGGSIQFRPTDKKGRTYLEY